MTSKFVKAIYIECESAKLFFHTFVLIDNTVFLTAKTQYLLKLIKGF